MRRFAILPALFAGAAAKDLLDPQEMNDMHRQVAALNSVNDDDAAKQNLRLRLVSNQLQLKTKRQQNLAEVMKLMQAVKVTHIEMDKLIHDEMASQNQRIELIKLEKALWQHQVAEDDECDDARAKVDRELDQEGMRISALRLRFAKQQQAERNNEESVGRGGRNGLVERAAAAGGPNQKEPLRQQADASEDFGDRL